MHRSYNQFLQPLASSSLHKLPMTNSATMSSTSGWLFGYVYLRCRTRVDMAAIISRNSLHKVGIPSIEKVTLWLLIFYNTKHNNYVLEDIKQNVVCHKCLHYYTTNGNFLTNVRVLCKLPNMCVVIIQEFTSCVTPRGG